MTAPRLRPAPPLLFVLLALAVFFGAIWTAKLTGSWESSVTYEQYRSFIPMVSKFAHP